MYPHRCPRCGRDYYDRENRFSIVRTRFCLECLEEVIRWEDEGGQVAD